MKKLQKRITALLLAGSLFALAACSSQQVQQSSSGSDSTAASGGDAPVSTAAPVTISLLVNQTWNKPSLKPSIDDFMAKNPDIKVDLQIVPDEQYPQLLNTKVASKDVPDMTMYNIGMLRQYFDVTKNLLPLTDQAWVSRLMNKDAVSVGGEVYGLPMNAMGSLIGVIYNKGVFAKNNIAIPKTHEELLAVCEKLKSVGITPFEISAKDGWTAVMWTVNIFPNAIADNVDIWNKINTGKGKFADYPEFESVFAKYNDLVKSGYVNADYLSSTYDMGVDNVASGKSAMLVQGDWWIADATKKRPDAQFGIFPVPFVANPRLGCGHTQVYSIFKESEYPEQCKRLLDHFAQVDVMSQTCVDWNCIPGLTDVKIELPYYVTEAMDNFINASGYGMPYPDMGINLVIEIDEMINITQEMLAGGYTPAEAIAAWDTYYSTQAKARDLPGWN